MGWGGVAQGWCGRQSAGALGGSARLAPERQLLALAPGHAHAWAPVLASRPTLTLIPTPLPTSPPSPLHQAEEEQTELATSFMAAKAKAPLAPQPQAAA